MQCTHFQGHYYYKNHKFGRGQHTLIEIILHLCLQLLLLVLCILGVDIQEGEVCYVPFKYVKTYDTDIDHLFLLK